MASRSSRPHRAPFPPSSAADRSLLASASGVARSMGCLRRTFRRTLRPHRRAHRAPAAAAALGRRSRRHRRRDPRRVAAEDAAALRAFAGRSSLPTYLAVIAAPGRGAGAAAGPRPTASPDGRAAAGRSPRPSRAVADREAVEALLGHLDRDRGPAGPAPPPRGREVTARSASSPACLWDRSAPRCRGEAEDAEAGRLGQAG